MSTQYKIHINPYRYTNYRKLIKDYYLKLKKKAPEVASYHFLSKQCGFSSPNFIFLVIRGQRNLGYESIIKISQMLNFNKKETKFFEHLVFFDQSKKIEEKEYHLSQINSFKEFKEIKKISQDQSDYYQYWYRPVIRELVSLEKFKEDPVWISKKIKPSVDRKECIDALDYLEESNLIKRNKDGELMTTDQTINSSDEISQLNLKLFHSNMIELSKRCLNEPSEKRQVLGVTMSVNEKSFQKIKKEMEDFQMKIQNIIAQDQLPSTKVCHLGMQLFELTKS